MAFFCPIEAGKTVGEFTSKLDPYQPLGEPIVDSSFGGRVKIMHLRGAHSDVGGGYSDNDNLAILNFMETHSASGNA